MDKVIEQIDTMSDETRVHLVGEDKRIPQKAMPSSLAAVINWAANEASTPVLMLGQVVHLFNGRYYEAGKMYEIMEAALRRLALPISLAVDPDVLRATEKSLSVCLDRYGSDLNMNPRGLNFMDGRLMISQYLCLPTACRSIIMETAKNRWCGPGLSIKSSPMKR